MKWSITAVGIACMTFNCAAWADETPTCRWLHLDEDTRVYQCAVLSVAQTDTTSEVRDTLPDPTLPLGQQEARQKTLQKSKQNVASVDSNATLIPEYLREALASNGSEIPNKTIVAVPAPIKSSLPPIPSIAKQLTPALPSEDVTIDVTIKEPKGRFMVLAASGVEATKAKLIAHKERDYSLLKSTGQLSLGIYSSEKSALRRQAALLKIGIESNVKDLNNTLNNTEALYTSSMHLAAKKEILTKPMTARHIEPVSQIRVVEESKSVTDYVAQPVSYSETVSRQPHNTIVSGYLVATIGEQLNILKELKRLGAKDVVALTEDPYLNRVSLGVYLSYANALARQDYFKGLGIDSELISRRESRVVRSTLSSPKPRDEPYGFDQIALRPLDI